MMYHLIVDGKNLAEFGLTMYDQYTPAPEPKFYYEDISGGNGVIDQTEFGGDVVYEQAPHSFSFYIVEPDNFMDLMTDIKSFLHGRFFSYELSWDPGYVYQGRFRVSEIENETNVGRFTLSVDTQPYKSKGLYVWLVNAAGGVAINLPCGRKSQNPTIEVQRTTLVTYEGTSYVLEPGAYKIRDLWITQGDNTLIVNSAPEYSRTVWTDYIGRTWTDFTNKRWSDIAAGDLPLQQPDTWDLHAGSTWNDLSGRRWIELAHPAEYGDEYSVYIQYEWEDL